MGNNRQLTGDCYIKRKVISLIPGKSIYMHVHMRPETDCMRQIGSDITILE